MGLRWENFTAAVRENKVKTPTQLPRSEICHSYLTTGEPPAFEEAKDQTRKLSHYWVILTRHRY